jgi:hypothetical protein
MLTVVCWKWGSLFSAAYVNRLRAALERHLQLQHELVCVTDDATGIDGRVRIVTLPATFAATPRCRRRMQVFSGEWASDQLGQRLLCVDLDVVLVGNITRLVDRPEPLVCWKVGYAGVFSGSWLLMDAGELDGLWRQFEADPDGYPRKVSQEKVPSDQAMLNAYLARCRRKPPVPFWTEAQGLVTYFGEGYARHEHRGVGPGRPQLPRGARVVVLGSADKAVMDDGRYDWVREHWTSLPGEAA